MKARTAGGVAAQSASVIPTGGASSSIATVCRVRPTLSITHVGHPQQHRERLRVPFEPVYELQDYSLPVEIRTHLNGDLTIRQFRVGVRFVTPQHPVYPPKSPTELWLPQPDDEPTLRQADQVLVKRFGKPAQNPKFPPKPGGWDAEYLDPLGWGYLDRNGKLVGLRSDAGHINR
jgi:hypothetical protein